MADATPYGQALDRIVPFSQEVMAILSFAQGRSVAGSRPTRIGV